jgi:signal transduction histidine kinase/CheY-like chemotaxis protein
MRILWKLYFVSLCFVLSAVAVLATVVSFLESRRSLESLRRAQKLLATIAASQVEAGYHEKVWPFELLDSMSRAENFVFWRIEDGAGRTVLTDSPLKARSGRQSRLRADAPLPAGGRLLAGDEPGTEVWVIPMRMRTGRKPWTFQLGYHTQAVRQQIYSIALTNALAAVCVSIALLPALMLLTQRSLRPLRALTSAAGEMKQGRLDVSLPAATGDEVGQLVTAFRAMAGSIKVRDAAIREKVRALAEARDELEVRVQERTADLELSNERLRAEIAERRKVEEQLQQAKVAAEAANRAKSEFLANMSHEIRTPMNGVMGMTEIALKTEMTTEQRRYLTLVKESADSLLAIINDVLDFSKIEAGKLELDPRPFDLREWISDTARILAVKAEDKGLELLCHVVADVPTALVGDPVRLRQVIVNLVGNAIKFTEVGEVEIRVETESLSEDEAVLRFSVRDTGIGIAPEKQQAIFRAFEQGDSSTSRRYGGTGLGLSISAKLVELMGGRIWVESQLGRGALFRFTARLGVHPEPLVERAALPVAALRDMPILIVDDNETNRTVLSEMTRSWQMRPALAGGGREALRELRKAAQAGGSFPLVLLDASMPGMDGFEVAERIRQEDDLAGVTIMMLSSVGLEVNTARCKDLGIDVYLVKPIRESELLRAILRAVRPEGEEKGRPGGPSEASGASRNLRVLLAEDNRINQEVARHMLGQLGHAVTVAADGKEALAAFEAGTVDVVFMDVQMPEMNGLEATAAIREREKSTGRHVPIVAMTAHAMKGDREQCLEAGMDDYLAKPIRREALKEALDRVAAGEHGADRRASKGKAGTTVAQSGESEVFDKTEALARVGGSEEAFVRVARMFLEDAPGMVERIRQGIAAGDATMVGEAAHSLKGSVGIFAAEGAFEAALTLQDMGRGGDLRGAGEAFEDLKGRIARLVQALQAAAKEGAECAS